MISAAVTMAALPGAAFALGAGDSTTTPEDVEVNLGLDEFTPSVRYKVNYSDIENAEIAEWLTDREIPFVWREDDGARFVYVEDWTDEAQTAMNDYNDDAIRNGFDDEDIAEVNAEVDALLVALADAGIDAEAPFDLEGFKDLIVNISPDDPNADALWAQANTAIASVSS